MLLLCILCILDRGRDITALDSNLFSSRLVKALREQEEVEVRVWVGKEEGVS